ncbi:ABC transporter ATP-binding protein [Methanobacterium petrolearium]|uniref:ABC transporter ATP-binding protein n=1 Tax=Methanobacterium petrolearium TaxID=710190 RepID=UPI001AE4240D|nr:ABC transporter ATP-binding protein [Methanobacterium petrolearium]MBP1944761.1 putative ABC transport system ATP-binding protein [Methanobacterium petrolearium]BDZ70035.1 ABC transporter ATP-binding protein [Methanobacterium petrolearium]
MTDILNIKEVWKTYKMGAEKINALQGVNFKVEKGGFLAVMGPSGSGKSTLLHLAGILDLPTEGDVFIGGENVSNLSGKKQAHLRRTQIGFVFQRFNLLSQLTALENVMLPMMKPDKEKAREILDRVGLKGKYNRLPTQLSGGEEQRVAIARSLANDPLLILADEPTGELDTTNSKMIMELLGDLNQEGMTIIIVTHDPMAAEYAQKTVQMRDGKIYE